MLDHIEITRLRPAVERPNGINKCHAHTVGETLGLLRPLRIVVRRRPFHLTVRESICVDGEKDICLRTVGDRTARLQLLD